MDSHCQRKRIARTEGRRNGESVQRGCVDLALLLPDDVLADIFSRLAPRWLAASRCVCKAWRAVVDGRRLLRADLLPLWLDGLIFQFSRHEHSPEFFSCPRLPVSGKLENLTTADVCGHCNGLLLCNGFDADGEDYYCVANPAIGWKTILPPCPYPCLAMRPVRWSKYLVFDPTVSNRYEVFEVRDLGCEPPGPWDNKPRPVSVLEKSEWPPPQFDMNVFSSTTGRWEYRPFTREGEAAGTAADIRSKLKQCCGDIRVSGSAYWRGALYVHGGTDFVLRISSSDGRYRVIKAPPGIGVKEYTTKLRLARSEKGVYFASLCNLRIRVWMLDESCGHSEWVLKHDNNLKPVLPRRRQVDGPWILQAAEGYPDEALSEPDEKFGWNCPLRKDNFEWDSDGDDVPISDDAYMLQADNADGDDVPVQADNVVMLGFHPYKEIVFLSQSSEIGLAYHLKSSRLQVLGSLSPANGGAIVECEYKNGCISCLPYTPCWIEEFPGNN